MHGPCLLRFGDARPRASETSPDRRRRASAGIDDLEERTLLAASLQVEEGVIAAFCAAGRPRLTMTMAEGEREKSAEEEHGQ